MAGVDALVLPLLASLAMELVHLTAVAALMTETRPVRPAAVGRALRSTPAIIGDAIALVRSSAVLAALVAVEFLWGFGMVAFETFTPARLSEVLQDAASWADDLTCRRQVFRWLTRYNTRRRHSWCRYQTPNTYEAAHTATLQDAA